MWATKWISRTSPLKETGRKRWQTTANLKTTFAMDILLAHVLRSVAGDWIMNKRESTIPGLSSFPGRDLKLKTPYSFLEARRSIDGAEGLWRIRNNLYDLEDFAKHHPGGSEWIRLTKGTDITEIFESHHITDRASKLLPKYFVREAAAPRTVPLSFKPDGFFHTFKKRALEALKGVDFHRPSRKSNLIADFLCTTFILLCLAAAHKQCYLLAMGAGVFLTWTTIVGHNYFHMRDSFRMYYFDFSLLSSKDWRISHAMSHHPYPNTLWDYEMYALEPYLVWLPGGKKSLITGMISMIMSPIIWSLLFIEQGIKRYYSVFFEFKTVEFRDIVPFLVPAAMSFFAPNFFVALKLWTFIILESSFLFSMVGFNAAHHHPDIFHDGDIYRDDLDWGLLELDAVRDRHIIDDSDFLVLTNFGLHGIHHLLPTVDHSYLPRCVKAFEDTCKDFGISLEKFSQLELVKGQFQQLLRRETKKNCR